MTDRRQQDSQAGKQRGDSPADDNPEPQGFWARVWVAFKEEVLGDREPDGDDPADDSSEPRPSGLWERLKSRLSFDDEDEDRPWIYDYPYHWKYFRTERRDLWADAITLGLMALSLMPLYFMVPHVRPVVDKTAAAAYAAVKHEIVQENLKSAKHDRDYYSDDEEEEEEDGGALWGHTVRTVLSQRDSAAAHAGMIAWLGVARPGLSIQGQAREIRAIDAEISSVLRHRLIYDTSDTVDKPEPTYSTRATCLGGAPRKPWLVMSVVPNVKYSPGYTFAVYWRGDRYGVSCLDDSDNEEGYEASFPYQSKPKLQPVDLDMNGATEVVETWHGGEEKMMLARVFRLNKDNAWECVGSYPDCLAGELKLISIRKGVLPRIAITEEVPDFEEEDESPDPHRPAGLWTTVYVWDKGSESLEEIGEYTSEVSGI